MYLLCHVLVSHIQASERLSGCRRRPDRTFQTIFLETNRGSSWALFEVCRRWSGRRFQHANTARQGQVPIFNYFGKIPERHEQIFLEIWMDIIRRQKYS
jgi:hypothetical protein